MQTKGWFWHVHHAILLEWSDDITERIEFIQKYKLAHEIPQRLKLLKPVVDVKRIEKQKAYAALQTDPIILALHAKECPNCSWDGKSILSERE